MTLGALVRRTARFDRSKVDISTGLRCATGIGAALAVSLATGHPGGGAFVAVGALLTAFASFQPGYRRRASVLVVMAMWLAVMTLVGGLVGSWGWMVVALTGASSFVAGQLVVWGPNATNVALFSTFAFVLASSRPADVPTAVLHAALIGTGGLLEALVVAGPWPRHPLRPERRALAAAYGNLARYAAGIPRGQIVLPDPKVIEDIRTTLTSAPRHDRWGQARAVQSLADEAVRVRETLGALTVIRHGLDPVRRRPREVRAALDTAAGSVAAVLASLSSSIGEDRPPPSSADHHHAVDEAEAALAALYGSPGATPEAPENRSGATPVRYVLELVRALHGQLRSIERIVAPGIANAPAFGSAAPVHQGRLRDRHLLRNDLALVRANLDLGSSAFRHALRLAVAGALATLLSRALPGSLLPASHTYWIVIGALVVLKPDFTTTMTRGLGRAAGTLVGAGLATLVAAGLRPGPVTLAIMATVIAAAVFTIYQANYGVYAVGLTTLVVIFAAMGGLPPIAAAADRTMDNLIGVGLALTVFLLWPTWTATEVRPLLARMLVTASASGCLALDRLAGVSGVERRALDGAGSMARLARSNAEAAVERMANEPDRSRSLAAEVADGIVAATHRFGLAAMALQAHASTSHPAVDGLSALRDGIMATMTSLAGALVGRSEHACIDLRSLHAQLTHRLTAPGPAVVADDVTVVLDETDFMVDAVDTMARLVALAGHPEPSAEIGVR